MPIVPLLMAKCSQYIRLDLSNCDINHVDINDGFSEALSGLYLLEDVKLRDCFSKCRPDGVKMLLENLLKKCNKLKAIDVSFNHLPEHVFNHFL